jgi:hypothetical protein
LHIGPSDLFRLFFFLGHVLLCSAPSAAGVVLHPWPPLCRRRRSTSCLDDPHASSSPCPGSAPLPCCPPPHTPAPTCTHSTAPVLTHAQRPLSDLVHSFPHFFPMAFPFPELISSPDFHRHSWPSSIAAAAVAQPQSSTPIAPRQPTGALQPIQFHPPASEPSLPQRRPARAPPSPPAHRGQAALV